MVTELSFVGSHESDLQNISQNIKLNTFIFFLSVLIELAFCESKK